MNEFFKQFQNKARATKLSHDEKQAMRVQLYTYFERNGKVDVAPASVSRVPSPYYFFTPRLSAVMAALLLVIFSGGTAFAAQSSLPGDALYTVKINVNEKVATALATTPEAKAQVNATLATTRLEEAETLASTGKLDASMTAQLADNFTAHVAAAQANTAAVETNDPGTAAQIGAEFTSTLAAHGAILAQLGDDSSSTETMQNSNALAIQVQQTVQPQLDASQTNATDQNASQSGDAIAIATDVGAPDIDPSADARVTTLSTESSVSAEPMGLRVTVDASSSSSSVSIAESRAALTVAPTSTSVPPHVKVNKTMATTSIVSNPKAAQIAPSLGVQASSSLALAWQDFTALQTQLDATTSAQIVSRLNNLDARYANASDELAAGNNDAALTDFTFVLRAAVKMDTFFKAGKKFNLSLITSLI